MKKLKIIVIAVIALAAVLGTIHLIVNTNWPELVRSMHGK
jgi:hypothetical protein